MTGRDLLNSVDAFLPSEEDVVRMCPGESVAVAADHLQRNGARQVIVKLGGAGCYVLDGDGDAWEVPAYQVDAVDLTGAGDAFCGGFLVGIRETGDALWAALYGSVSASFIVEHSSAAGALGVDRGLAEARLEALATRVRRTTVSGRRG